MFKTNIDSISNASTIIKNLKPKTFYYDTTNSYGMSFSGKKQYGLIAQDVQTVLPELVSTVNRAAQYNKTGTQTAAAVSYEALNYNAFIALLIKGNQEQKQTIDSLKASNNHRDSLLNALAAAVASCCSSTSRTSQTGFNQSTGGNEQVTGINNTQTTTLSDANVLVLNQNQPNPFAEQTTITYNIPQTANQAQLLFYDVNGKQIQNVSITTRGKGALNVYANDLTNGVYSYTLIVDGQIIDTKKMVKQQ